MPPCMKSGSAVTIARIYYWYVVIIIIYVHMKLADKLSMEKTTKGSGTGLVEGEDKLKQ